MKGNDLRSEEFLCSRETMHIACIYGWLSRGWDQQRYGCKIDKSPFPDSSDLVADQMEASKIVWAMGRQMAPVRNWLFYAYGDKEAPDWLWHMRKVMYSLWRKAFEQPDDRNYRLAEMAVADFRKRCLNQGASPSEVLAAGLGVGEKRWDKEYRQRYSDCLDRLQAWDRHGVGIVSAKIREIREGRH